MPGLVQEQLAGHVQGARRRRADQAGGAVLEHAEAVLRVGEAPDAGRGGRGPGRQIHQVVCLDDQRAARLLPAGTERPVRPQRAPCAEPPSGGGCCRDVERHAVRCGGGQVGVRIAVALRDERLRIDTARHEVRVERQRQGGPHDVHADRPRAAEDGFACRAPGVQLGDPVQLRDERSGSAHLDHVDVLLEGAPAPPWGVADAPGHPQLVAPAAHRLHQVGVLHPDRVGPDPALARHGRHEGGQRHPGDEQVLVELGVRHGHAALAREVGDVERPGHALRAADGREVDAERGQHALPHAIGAPEGLPVGHRAQVAARGQQGDERPGGQLPPPLDHLSRLDAGQQHAEREDAPGRAVAVRELQPALAQGRHDACLPGDADAPAGEDQRPCRPVGHVAHRRARPSRRASTTALPASKAATARARRE